MSGKKRSFVIAETVTETPNQVSEPFNATWNNGTMTSIVANQGTITTINPGRWIKLSER